MDWNLATAGSKSSCQAGSLTVPVGRSRLLLVISDVRIVNTSEYVERMNRATERTQKTLLSPLYMQTMRFTMIPEGLRIEELRRSKALTIHSQNSNLS